MPNNSWITYSDFYKRSNYGIFPQEHRRSQGRLPFRMIYVEQGPHGFIDPMFSETILALPVEVDKQCNWGWKIGDRQHRQKAEAGQMLVVPADIDSQWDVDGGRKILVLAVPNETVRNVLGPSCPQRIGDAFWKLTEHTWADPFIEVMMNRLWESTAGNEAADSYLTDGLFLSILSQLLIRAGTSLQLNSNVALPQWRFKRVQQFVDSRLGDEINIDELASAAGLSRRHFSRSFAQETGETPHRWLMQQRLEKAKEMLSTTDFALCEIAEICGFSSQSHLTTTLKQATGMTPRNWRQHYRG